MTVLLWACAVAFFAVCLVCAFYSEQITAIRNKHKGICPTCKGTGTSPGWTPVSVQDETARERGERLVTGGTWYRSYPQKCPDCDGTGRYRHDQ